MISIIAREGEKEWIVLDLGEFFSIILMASGRTSWPVPGSKPTRYSKYLFYGRAELVSLGHQSSVWGPGTVSGRVAILTRDNTGESLESRDRVSKHFNSMCQCGETSLKPRWWHQGCTSPAWDRGPNKDRKPGRGSRLSWDTPSFLSGWCLCPIELSWSNGTIWRRDASSGSNLDAWTGFMEGLPENLFCSDPHLLASSPVRSPLP